ncbi:MAG: GGDEF domain-containing protein [Giesbergeria sp.]
MPDPAPQPFIDMRTLRLDTALALIKKANDQTQGLHQDPTDPTGYLQSLIDSLCELSSRDPLTGLANRRHFHTALERELDRVARSGEAALLMMLDIDHFKRINDTYGHVAGDVVLQTVATALAGCVRPMDTLARYGGEEFAIVMPACQTAFGYAVAERIRRVVESTPIKVAPHTDVHITLSIGCAFALQWIRSTTSLWTIRADEQLYLAKTKGRNRVCLEQQPDSTVSAEEKSLLFGTTYSQSAWDTLSPLNSNDSAY